MTRSTRTALDAVVFGPFCLIPSERLLLRDDVPVELGARTFDILVALVAKAHAVVPKRALMSAVWPDVTVEEGSLRFQIAALRRALGDGEGGARFITTAAGRGYCFVAPVARRSGHDPGGAADVSRPPMPHGNLPNPLVRVIGREAAVNALAAELPDKRFVTILGAGGIGKTTVAVSVGHRLFESFSGAVLFVDLSALRDPSLVPAVIASMLGVTVQSEDPTPSLLAYLEDRRLLLILDTCEHLIEAVAALSARLQVAAPQVHILATSREALRADGEHIHRLPPLSLPPHGCIRGAADLTSFPATELFLDRAAAGGAKLDLDPAGAALVSEICWRLDGVPLGIELAAGRVDAYGLTAIATLLEQRLNLLWQGRRTAPPRQRTLRATLDWSLELLSGNERVVLRRLAVFAGHFTMDAALAIATSAELGPEALVAAFDSLVGKSMVAARPIGAMMRYRLLDMTRARVLDIAEPDMADLAARHASYYRTWLEQAGAEWPVFSDATGRAPHLAALANVRVALVWCFGPDGDVAIGVGLAAAAAPVFLAMSLLTECQAWSERALLALDDATRGSHAEMTLQAALGMSLMFIHGESEAARAALDRSLFLADAQGVAAKQAQSLGPLHMFHTRIGDFKAAEDFARRAVALARTAPDPSRTALAHALLGIALHLGGDLPAARVELDAAAPARSGATSAARSAHSLHLGFDHRNWAHIALARTLWLQGLPEQAVGCARQAVAEATELDHPVTLSIALNWSVSVSFWIGDLDEAERTIGWFRRHAESHAMTPYLAVARGFQGELDMRRGVAGGGIAALRDSLAELHRSRYELLTTPFDIALIQGLLAAGRGDEALTLLRHTIDRVGVNGDLCYLPELLRLRAAVLLDMPGQGVPAAQASLLEALDLARRQGARSWALRTATDLAALRARQGGRDAAIGLLGPLLAEFTEGFGTVDLVRAHAVLGRLTARGA